MVFRRPRKRMEVAMPDKEMSKEQTEKLKNLIEDYMEFLEMAQAVYRGQFGVDYVRPLRLTPRVKKICDRCGFPKDTHPRTTCWGEEGGE